MKWCDHADVKEAMQQLRLAIIDQEFREVTEQQKEENENRYEVAQKLCGTQLK